MKLSFILFILLGHTTFAHSAYIDTLINNYKFKSELSPLESNNKLFKDVTVEYGYSLEDETGIKKREGKAGKDEDEESEREHQIALKFSFNPISSYQYLTELESIQKMQFQKASIAHQNEDIAIIYKLYISLHFGIQERDKLKNLLVIQQDAAKVSKVLLKKGKVFITDVIDAEKKISETQSLLKVKEEEVKNMQDQLSRLTGKAVGEDSFSSSNDFINVNKIVNLVEKAPKLVATNLDLRLARVEYEIEKENVNQIFDSFELFSSFSTGSGVSENKYDSTVDDSDYEKRNYGFKIGFKIPLFTDKRKMNEKRINKLKVEHEVKLDQQAMQEEQDEIKTELIGLVESLKSLLGSSYVRMTKNYLKAYRNSKGVSPFRLLQLKSILLQTEIKQAQIEKDIYYQYITFLEGRGALARNYGENVLAKNFKGEV